MGVRISVQLLLLARSVLLGVSAGVLYDLLRPLRRRHPRLSGPVDLCYSLTVSAASFAFLLRTADGVLRGYAGAGAAGGAVLFFCTLSRPLRPVWDYWADTLSTLAAVLSWPLARLRDLWKKAYAAGKGRSYYTVKYYTIQTGGIRRRMNKGGSGIGKTAQTKKKEGRKPETPPPGRSSAQGPAARPAGLRAGVASAHPPGTGGRRTR